jgi:hypothetical protein
MSLSQSNLSLPQYGYDLVVATTQDAINATMKAFLSGYAGQDLLACYQYDDATKSYVAMDDQQVTAAAGDPFAIPNGADQTDARVQKLDDLGFEFAFKARFGVPDGLAPTAIPDVIVLDQGNTRVSYQLFFAEFAVLTLEEHRHVLSWTNLTQPAGAPWVFRFNVDLDLRVADQSAFSRLPATVQQKVKNLNPDSAFGVQQLYLDLNTTGLQDSPDLTGLDKSSDAYVALTRIFLNTYWDRLKQSGDVLLGYAVKPLTPNPTHPSIVPTDLTIEVSPFVDTSGQPTTKYGLYTLDYLVMTDRHVMPAPVKFTWNWVEAAEEADFHGVMAVNRARMAQYLNALFSPALRTISIVPKCRVWYDWGKAEVMYSDSYSLETAAQTYRVVNDGTSHVLTFSYEKRASDGTGINNSLGSMELKNSTTSDVYLEGGVIRTVTTFTGYVDLEILGGKAQGNFVKYLVETSYQLNVDQAGTLVVSLAPGTPKLTDQSDRINPDGWSKFVTFGAVDGVVGKIKGFLSHISTFLTGHDRNILDMINGSSAWVFPGGKTFAFKAIGFSDHQDLTVHVTYVDP